MTKPKSLGEAVVDSSAIMSVFEGRPPAHAFKRALKCCDSLCRCAGTLLELSIIFIGRKDIKGPPLLDSFLASYKIAIIPFDQQAVVVGRQGCIDYSKKRNKTELNYGDLFSYSLAKARRQPLYFEGLDFLETDVDDGQ